MPEKWTTVTGASGFVGSQVLRCLLDDGQSVRVLYRDHSHVDGFESHPNLELVHTPDLFTESLEGLMALLDGSETLVHLAWYTEPGEYLTSPLNLSCLTGTLNMANAFSRVGGKRFVGLGSCAEYDTSTGVIGTDAPLAPGTLYAACKVSAYQVLQHFLKAEDISFAWCRIFYLYGEGEDGRRLVPYIRSQIEADEEVLLTAGKQVRDFLDVKDAARMIADVVVSDREGPVNICSGEGVTVRQLAESIADEYGRRDLLRFGAKPDGLFDPPKIIGIP
jgi:nucleoside-diphosphate-sugar epimerase